MKKIVSVIAPVIILAAGINLSFSVHTCHNHFAGWKVSVTEEKASCGMAADTRPVPAEGALHTDCCRDEISHLKVDDNFNPSFTILKVISPATIEVPVIPATVTLPVAYASALVITDTGPPDFYAGSSRLSSICIYRI